MSEMLLKAPRQTAKVIRPRDSRPSPTTGAASHRRKQIVIVGGGFAGIAAGRGLRRWDADVLLIDRWNHHIFQPLLCHAPGLKNLTDAVTIRTEILAAFELADTPDE